MFQIRVRPDKAERFVAVLEGLGADEVPDRNTLAEILKDICEDENDLDKIVADAEEYRFDRLLQQAWAHCISPLLREDASFHISDWKSDGGFRESLKVLAIWKIPTEAHRSIGYGPVEELDSETLQKLAGCSEKDVKPLRERLFNVWVERRKEILRACDEHHHWELRSDKSDKEECSVQDVAHSVFVLSHIGWERRRLQQAVPRSALQKLLTLKIDSESETSYWVDPGLGSRETRSPSVIATAMAVTGLADWVLSASAARKSGDLSDTASKEIESQGNQLAEARSACARGLRWLTRTWVATNGWMQEPGKGLDTKATSLAFNALERFADEYEIQTPSSLPYTRLSLVKSLKAGLDVDPATAHIDTVEQVAFATTALCRTARRTATFWLRNSIHWLLNTAAGDRQDSANAQYRNALRFYGVIELLRRRDCVHILRQLL